MSLVLACVDGSAYTASVADLAGWAARRLGAGVEVLEVLGRREAQQRRQQDMYDLGAPVAEVARELAAVDAERARLLRKQAELVLEEARFRVEAAGVSDVRTLLREGDLIETVAEREVDADMLVIGKRGEAADFARGHLGSNLERIVRICRKPILIAARAMRPAERLLIAYDGRPSAEKAVESIATSPLFDGMACTLLTVGPESDATRWRLENAAGRLRAAGRQVSARIEPGDPEHAVAAAVARDDVGLLAMGAYSHSRLRSLVIGSTTSAVIRSCKTQVLLFR
jgi:nucleotide-binding universal stress UspA family protein